MNIGFYLLFGACVLGFYQYVVAAVLFTNYGLFFLPRLGDGENAAGQKQPALQGVRRIGSLHGTNGQDFYLGSADFY